MGRCPAALQPVQAGKCNHATSCSVSESDSIGGYAIGLLVDRKLGMVGPFHRKDVQLVYYNV
jgi:hypothetical protein